MMAQSVRVLHVDDDPDFAELAATFLERFDDRINVETVTRVDDGLEILDKGVDCVVSDYDMPEKNGLQFLKAVRENDPNLPFILFTGKGSEEVASDAISAGVTDYLQKESGTDQYTILANRIRNSVQHHQFRRELVRHQGLLTHTERLADTGGWEADVETGEQRWTEGTYRIHDIPSASEFDPSVDVGVDFYHDADQDTITDAVERCMTAGESYDLELRLISATNRMKWVHTRGEPVRENGEIVAIRGAIQDVTEEVEQRRDLEELNDRYEAFVEHSQDIISVIDQEGTIQYQSPVIESVLGYDQDELLGANVFEYIHPDDQVEVVERFGSVVGAPDTVTERIEFRFEHTDGSWVYLEAIGSNRTDSALDGYVITSRDITDRKEREEQLARLNKRHEMVLSNIRETILVTDEQGRFTYVCPNVRFILGYTTDEVEAVATVHELFGDPLYDEEQFQQDGELRNVQATITDKTGTERDVLLTVREVDIEDGLRLYSIREVTDLLLDE